jgi:hypothetical protein
MNVKGIIESDSSKRAVRPKMAYYAMQNVATVFDDQLERIRNFEDTHNLNASTLPDEVKYNKGTDRSIAVYGYAHKTTKKQVFTIWNNEYIPTNSNAFKNLNLTFFNAQLDDPVFIDMLTGAIYEIPESQMERKDKNIKFKQMPIYDSPVLIADKSIIKF